MWSGFIIAVAAFVSFCAAVNYGQRRLAQEDRKIELMYRLAETLDMANNLTVRNDPPPSWPATR
jgi:hypothetical protein